MAKPNGFGDICEKLLSDPYVMFLVKAAIFFDRSKNPHTNSMQNTTRNIRIKFGSNWTSNVRGEEFWKIVNGNSSHGPQPGELKSGHPWLVSIKINPIQVFIASNHSPKFEWNPYKKEVLSRQEAKMNPAHVRPIWKYDSYYTHFYGGQAKCFWQTICCHF